MQLSCRLTFPSNMLVQLEQEQILRDSIAELPDKVRAMIRMLFFEIPTATL